MSTEQRDSAADRLLISNVGTLHRAAILEHNLSLCHTPGLERFNPDEDDYEKTCKSCFSDEGAQDTGWENECPVLRDFDRDQFKIREYGKLRGFATSQPCGVCFDDEPADDSEVAKLTSVSKTHVHAVPEDWGDQ